VQRVIFASGSPFPVFPAHRVKNEWLIDGGYSSNVPVDAARTVSAQQLLIVHSAHPVEEYQLAPWRRYPGRLIANLARLPGFLFARSQEVDRLSRRGVFVASLAPPRDEPDWPSLTDFQKRVVQRMLDEGKEHLGLRIGLVESWGEPSFHVTRVAALAPK
jgi:predicted acylesterase/phospholipase RssA